MVGESILPFFTDPILRGPTLATLFLSMSLSLIGVLIFFQRRTLFGETISHAAYPGVVIGLALTTPPSGSLAILTAVVTAFFASSLVKSLEKTFSQDLALSYTLSSFFGLGVLLISALQFSYGPLGKMAEAYLFGQVATMTDVHIGLYAFLFLIIALFTFFFYRPLKLLLFDPLFGQTLGTRIHRLHHLVTIWTVLILIFAIRSVGVILLTGALIAPVIAAKPIAKKLSHMFVYALVFSALGSLSGTMISYHLTKLLHAQNLHSTVPQGPLIVLASALIALVTNLIASQGLCAQWIRSVKFTIKIHQEHLFKFLRKHPGSNLAKLHREFHLPRPLVSVLLMRMETQGYLTRKNRGYVLTKQGEKAADTIIRLHRLWELYLVTQAGFDQKEVHPFAEEMEHVLTQEMEQELTKLLNNPTMDPHCQPIPKETLL